jgi:glycosyltransferase involved in cell wall biosynthesis
MDALIYSPVPSHPANAGNRQMVYHIGKYMKSVGYTVHYVYCTFEGLVRSQYEQMRQEWDYFDVIVKSPTQPGPRTMGDVYAKDDWYQADVGDFLLWKVTEFDIRMVLFNYIFQSKALELLPRHVRKVLLTHDRMSDRHKMFDLHGMRREFYYTTPEEEGAALRRADEIIAVQAGEAKFFHQVSGRPVHVLRQFFPPRMDVARQSLQLRRIGYLGSNNLINFESIRNFIQLYKKHQISGLPLTLVVAGGVCDRFRDVAGDGIEVIGKVGRLEDFYRSVDLVINPMMFGTGLKIKTVEALSFGVPIVSTRAGMSGIVEATHPYHSCESVEELIQAIDLITRQPTALAELRQASRKLFAEYYADTMAQLQKILPPVDSDGSMSQFEVDGMAIEPHDFGHRGWYSAEVDNEGHTFRWLGPEPQAEIFARVPRHVPVACNMSVINAIQPEVFKSLEIEIDGMPADIDFSAPDEHVSSVRFVMPPRHGDPNIKTKITVRVRETISPVVLNPAVMDMRRLGVAVRRLMLKPA